jgi:hypothetical protein
MAEPELDPNGGLMADPSRRQTLGMWALRRRATSAIGGFMAAILLTAGLTGCAALGSALAPGGILLPLAGSLQTHSPQHYSDGSTSERGNIPKVVGEKAGVLSADGQTHVLTFTVTRIGPDPPCLNQGAPAPENGHYVEVDLAVVTTAGMGIDGGDAAVSFAPENWFYYPPDGDGLIADGIGASRPTDECRLSVAALPDPIGPSQTVSGSVLLDVAPGAVYLAYVPQNGCGCSNAWEWPYSSG